MKFAHPVFLLLALGSLPLVGWALARFERARRAALASFASDRLLGRLAASVSPGRRTAKRVLLTAGMATLLLALARPQWGWREEEVKRRGVDLLFAVDTSKSMLAQDVRPNRLERAKLAVLDLLDKLEGDRVGLIAFAGTAFLQCPLTLDQDAFRLSLDTLDTNVIPKGGTDLASAIREAMETLKAGAPGQKILILLTDGEDLEQGALAAAKEAAKEGLRIFAVGVGTPAGELIPVPTGPAAFEFAKDPEGRVVKSRLDEKTLAEIASSTGGIYQPLGTQGEGLRAVYQRGLASLPRAELLSRLSRIPIERFPWVLGLGLLLLAAEWLLGDRRRAPGRPGIPSRALPAAVWVAAGLAASSAHAALWSAENAYKEGRFQDALIEYQKAAKQDPKRPEVQFNLGAASYKSGDFPAAAGAFLKAATTAKSPELPPKALYNLGNSLYRAGQAMEKTKTEQTIQAWENALKAYEQSLKLKSDDADAKFNRDFVKRKLEELKKQQPQEKKNPPKDPQKNQDKDQPKDQQPQPSQQSSSPRKQDQGSPNQDSSPSPQKPQQSPPEQGKDGKDHEDANQNKPGQPKPQPQDQGKEPKPQPSSPKPDKGDGKESQAATAQPGQMTPEEAKALLDALRGDERKMPLAVDRMGRAPAKDEPPKRDW